MLVLIEVKELQEDIICYNAIFPNSSEILEDSDCYDVDSYISRNPEPLMKYAAASSSSSSMQQKHTLKSDDALTINICSADNTQLFFISFDIFLLINDFEFSRN